MTRELRIVPVLNGFVVHAGCQAVVFPSILSLLDGLREYYAAPEQVEERYLANAVNRLFPAHLVGAELGNQRVVEPTTEVSQGEAARAPQAEMPGRPQTLRQMVESPAGLRR